MNTLKTPKTPFYKILAGVFLCASLIFISISNAKAQSLLDNQVALSDTEHKVFIANALTPILDPKDNFAPNYLRTLYLSDTDESISLNKHKLFFKQSHKTHWFILNLTNTTSHKDWALHLGSALSGKLGTIKAINVVNASTNKTLLSWKKHMSTQPPQYQ